MSALELLHWVPLAANTSAIARREGFTTEGTVLGKTAASPKVGDTVTAVVSLFSIKRALQPKQWLVRLTQSVPSPVEQARLKNAEVRYYANTDEEFIFRSAFTALDIESIGPVLPDSKPERSFKTKHNRIFVRTDFLGLDLTPTSDLLFRMREEAAKTLKGSGSFQIGARGTPFSKEEAMKARENLASLNLTYNEVRSLCGNVPALQQFFDVVRAVPELQGILFQILDKPSLIDVFRHGTADKVHFEFVGGGPSTGGDFLLGAGKGERLGFLHLQISVFGKPALTLVLFITTPTPPLLATAGVVGLVAVSPSKPEKVVTVRVLSSAVGGESSKP